MIAGLTLLASCSSDGGGVAPGEVPSPSLKDKNGNKVTVTKVGNYYFNYDDEGKLKSFGNSSYNEHYEIADDKFSIKYVANDGYSDMAEVEINASLNSAGYISAIEGNLNVSYEDKYELMKEEASVFMKFYYDSNGQLNRIEGDASVSGEEGEYEDGQLYSYKFSYSSSIDNKLDWKDGNLISLHSEINTDGNEGGERYNYTSETDYNISYGNKQNPARQHTYYLSNDLFEDAGSDLLLIDAFAIVGLMGKGTAMLPTAYSYKGEEYDDYYGEGDNWQGNYTLSFTLNSNGTINTEKRNNEHVTFQYGTTAQNNSKETRSIAEEITRSMPKFFKRHINKK